MAQTRSRRMRDGSGRLGAARTIEAGITVLFAVAAMLIGPAAEARFAGHYVRQDVVQTRHVNGWTFLRHPGSQFTAIVAGPDQHMWLSDAGNASLARIAMDGTLQSFPLFYGQGPSQKPVRAGYLTFGPGQKLYFGGCETTGNQCGFSGLVGIAQTDGTYAMYLTPSGDGPGTVNGLGSGPHGDVWFAESSHVGRISQTGAIAEYPYLSGLTGNIFSGMALTVDRAWFDELPRAEIAYITPSTGKIFQTQLPGGCSGSGMTLGGDGALYTACGAAFARITTGLHFTTYPLISDERFASGVQLFASTPDGHLWLAVTDGFLEVDVDVVSYVLHVAPRRLGFFGLVLGPDGNLWGVNGTDTIGVYTRVRLTVAPARVTLAPGGQAMLSARESPSQPLTASTSNASVATVATGSQQNTFVVTAVSAGTAEITVADLIGNSFVVKVTVT